MQKQKILILIFSLFFMCLLIAQPNSFREFPHQNADAEINDALIIKITNGNLIAFFKEGSSINFSMSSDNGNTWSTFATLANDALLTDSLFSMSALQLADGKIIFTYKKWNRDYPLFQSSDNGANWNFIINLPTGMTPVLRFRSIITSVVQTVSEDIYFVFHRSISDSVFFIKSTDGINWNPEQLIMTNASNSSMLATDNNELLLFFERSNGNDFDIYYTKSTNAGINWSNPQSFLSSNLNERRPQALKTPENKLWIFYEIDFPTPFENIYQKDILYKTSTNNGIDWSESQQLTTFKGFDGKYNVSSSGVNPPVVFNSARSYDHLQEKKKYYFGMAGIDEDISPPYMHKFELFSDSSFSGISLTIRALAEDITSNPSVKIVFSLNNMLSDTLEMKDDGLNGDSLSGDNIYGIVFSDLIPSDHINFYFLLENQAVMNSYMGTHYLVNTGSGSPGFVMDINKITLPLENTGSIAQLSGNPSLQGGWFDDISFLFAGGFALSGYSNNQLWGNGVMSSALIRDYLSGPVSLSSSDPRNILYVIKESDPPFGDSWQLYRAAVDLGAAFYDGDGDGIYNPIDKNNNGIWDPDEDKPDIIGDVTAWTVYSDKVPSNHRRYNSVEPQGIEIQQTVFAYKSEPTTLIDNTIFIRYRIINRGTVAEVLDSILFSIWSDPDLGYHFDDLAATDTIHQSVITYNDGEDNLYGINPPAFFAKLYQGPAVFISGETFIDLNGNGIYDPGIDSSLSYAHYNKGLLLGKQIIPGARNAELNSSTVFWEGLSIQFSGPDNHIQLRNNQQGLMKTGQPLDPCMSLVPWQFFGVNCSEINPAFMISGDPVKNYGWIQTTPWDIRKFMTTGPFQLKQNEPVDIIVGYLVGRAHSPLSSIEYTRSVSNYTQYFYESNFSEFPVSVGNDDIIVDEFRLHQNFPNPFNPNTIIRYQIPDAGNVSLKVFDILGREVETLVNEFKSAGGYEVTFKASQFASGVYFYRLQTGKYVQTKKMLLVK